MQVTAGRGVTYRSQRHRAELVNASQRAPQLSVHLLMSLLTLSKRQLSAAITVTPYCSVSTFGKWHPGGKNCSKLFSEALLKINQAHMVHLLYKAWVL